MLRSSRTVHHHQLRDRVMKMKIERWTKQRVENIAAGSEDQTS